MFARVTIATAQLGKTEEVTRVMQDYFVALKKQKGFKGGILLIDPPTGKALSVALWETEADIRASESSGYYKEWIGKLSDALALPPAKEIYQVGNLVNFSLK